MIINVKTLVFCENFMSAETFTYWGMLYSPIRERLRTHKVSEFSYSSTGVFCWFFFLSFLFTIFYSCTKIYVYFKEICSP